MAMPAGLSEADVIAAWAVRWPLELLFNAMAISVEGSAVDKPGSQWSLRQLLVIVLGWGVLFGKWLPVGIFLAVAWCSIFLTACLYRSVRSARTIACTGTGNPLHTT